jgi:IS30 family transposase
MNYKQLTQGHRYQIYALMKMGHTQNTIAEMISVHMSTINRELRRNRGLKGYRPNQAHQLSMSRRYRAQSPIDQST